MLAGSTGNIDLISNLYLRIGICENKDASGRVGNHIALESYAGNQYILKVDCSVLCACRNLCNGACARSWSRSLATTGTKVNALGEVNDSTCFSCNTEVEVIHHICAGNCSRHIYIQRLGAVRNCECSRCEIPTSALVAFRESIFKSHPFLTVVADIQQELIVLESIVSSLILIPL